MRTEPKLQESSESFQHGEEERPISKRGFASMDPEAQREIARRGGRAAHEYGTAHEFNSEEAKEAGRLGGYARSRKVNKA